MQLERSLKFNSFCYENDDNDDNDNTRLMAIFKTTWVSRHQNVSILDIIRAKDDR